MKFETEQDSINYLVGRLQEKGWENIDPTQAKDKYCYYDIEALFKGKKIRIECKRRNIKSTDFNDAIMEHSKYGKFIDGLRNKEFDYGYLVNFFTDCITVSNVTKPLDVIIRNAQATTDFANNTIVEKYFVKYKQEKKLDY